MQGAKNGVDINVEILKGAFEVGNMEFLTTIPSVPLLGACFPLLMWTQSLSYRLKAAEWAREAKNLEERVWFHLWEISMVGTLALPLLVFSNCILHILCSQFAWQAKEQVLLPQRVLLLLPRQLLLGFASRRQIPSNHSRRELSRSAQKMGFLSGIPRKQHKMLGTCPVLSITGDFQFRWGHVHFLSHNKQE